MILTDDYFGSDGIIAKDFNNKLSHWVKGEYDQWSKIIRYVEGDYLKNHIDSGDTEVLKKREWTLIVQLSMKANTLAETLK